MGGRGSASGRANGKSLSRWEMADRITDLKAENKALFKMFFRQDKSKFSKERAKHERNSKEIESLRKRIEEYDKKTGVNQRAKGSNLVHTTTTTTYEKARKNRMKNFDNWYFGSSKK